MIIKMLKSKDLRNKLFLTLTLLFIYRLGTFITVPGVDSTQISASQDSMLGFLNTFSGGSLANFSIFAVGIMPYITSSIIIQLLQLDVVPKLVQWSKEGESGQKKIKNLTRVMTVILGFLQSLGLAYGFNAMYGIVINPGVLSYLTIAIVLTLGTVVLMIFGEMITEKGLGNGISVIILAGIISSLPNSILIFLTDEFYGTPNLLISSVKTLLIVLVFLVIVAFVVFFTESVRKIPINYTKQVVGNKVYSAAPSFIPIKLNPAGVVPVIFAVALFVFPPTIAQFMEQNSVTSWIINTFDYTKPLGLVIYGVLIALFSFFYAFVQTNPEKLAKNLQDQNAFVPGIRPGEETERYFTKVLKRVTTMGTIFLVFIASLPIIINMFLNLPQQVQIGGISLLIVINVALDTTKQVKTAITGKEYKGFIK